MKFCTEDDCEQQREAQVERLGVGATREGSIMYSPSLDTFLYDSLKEGYMGSFGHCHGNEYMLRVT